jgi:hypothetical protein
LYLQFEVERQEEEKSLVKRQEKEEKNQIKEEHINVNIK